MTIDDFILPFSGSFSADNCWVRLARIIPWEEIEKDYVFLFPSDRGNVAKPVRMALGALITQTRCGYTDRELVQQITENPYLQYFIGLRKLPVDQIFYSSCLGQIS
ncbi:transposase [Sporomusa carbonis]|uniref:transposase n=1 Tax=Sporomusa carbonis TaxID=3076075 RepID=UPI003C7B92BA